jgi:uncharacterized membrane protein YccC
MSSRAVVLENARQALKTALAGIVSLFITQLFHLPEGYWAAISALIVMQSNVGATLAASRTRLAGTAVGAIIGGAFVAIWGANMLAFGLAVTIAFFICTQLQLAESQRLATVTVAIVMLITRTSSAWVVAFHRFSEVALGILVALLVSLVLWPNHARRSVRQGLAAALTNVRAFYQAVMQRYRGQPADPVEALRGQAAGVFRKNADLLQNALQEAFGMKERESLVLFADQAERMFRAVETLEFTVREGSSDTYFRRFETGIDQLQAGISDALESLAATLSNSRPGAGIPNLLAIVSSLEQRAAEARKAGATRDFPLDEVLRFYFLLMSSRHLVTELERAHAIVAARGQVAAGLPLADNGSRM